ncbi:MAG: BamA/TamA family outer membrane protein [Chitinophagales bacterium]|nr:BamA/TamA family outer membrane protein [Chitinophagales bacterium]
MPKNLKATNAGLLFLLFAVFFISGCRVAKNLPEGQSLLVKNKFVINKKELTVAERDKIRTDFANIVAQKPNRRFLGVFPARMWLYYSATKGKKLTRFKQWIIDKVGEEPVVFDSLQADKSDRLLENYMFNFGFFYADVNYTTSTNKKKTKVVYTITNGPKWKVGEITYQRGKFKSDSIAYNFRINTALKPGDRFDIAALKAERERIESVLRNAGFFYFSREYVMFDLDTISETKTVNIKVSVLQPSDTAEHKQYRMNNFYITTDYATDILNDTLQRDTVYTGDSLEYMIISHKRVLRKNIVSDAMFMKRGGLYSRNNEIRTLNRLNQLGTFKFITLDFMRSKGREGYLDCIVSLTPAKKQSISGTVEANVTNEGLFGVAGSISYKNRNLSQRADQLLVDASAGVQLRFSRKQNVQVITSTASTSITYYLNRFLVPFRAKVFSRNTNPKTRLNVSYNFENRFDFDTSANVTFLYQLHNFSSSFGYEWNERITKRHLFNPLTVSFYLLPKRGDEFIKRLNSNPILKSSFEEQVIIGPNYTFVYDNQRSSKDRIFMYFRGSLETAGNIIYAGYKLANLKNKNDSLYLMFNKPFSQYFRAEADWRNYFRIRNHGMFAIRTFAGIGVPYGNSYALPFIKQFFVGGPNSLRGFLIREVGPGGYVDSTAYNPETGEKKNIGFFNQTGDIKLELNAEFRFDIYKWLKGALFMDAGNVWTLRKDARTNGNFAFNRFWKEFALDVGAGLRLDFNFFVIRLDYGFPLRDPRKSDGDRWLFENAQFRKGQFQLAIGYPF